MQHRKWNDNRRGQEQGHADKPGTQTATSPTTACVLCPAQVPRRMIGTDAFQETPIVEVTRAITKHNFLVMDIKDLPRVMKEAFYLARSGRPGEPP